MPHLRLTRGNASIYGSFLLALVALILCGRPLTAQENASGTTTVREADGFALSPPVRELAKLPRAPQYSLHQVPLVRRIPKRDFGIAVDPVEQNTARPTTNFTIGSNILGVGNGFPGFGVTDPDPETNMAVGDTQIVQWVNGSFAVFNKFTGATLAGPIAGNILFQALGGACAANDDVELIAQWDNAAHRWFLAQNTLSGPQYYACIAVSTSADALGTYYLYLFSLGTGFPDYQKWGRWNNNWAQTMNNYGPGGGGPFMGAEVCVYNRMALLNNQGPPPRVQVCFQLPSTDDSLLPADIDSSNSPPAAEDQFFIGSVDQVDNSHLSLYSVHINWLLPSQAYITGNHNSQLITVPTYTGSCGGAFGIIACVPQKGVSDQLDSLGDRLMYRFAYDNDPVGGNQHWYVNHDVEASGGQIGVRWYEFHAPQISIQPAGLTLFQSGTYAPDSNYRWMGSVAADITNDILAGYSESSSSMYPSIAVAGRLKSDPPNTLESEVSVLAGTGSQTDTSGRWGTFSAMRLDPDGCTFWYTTEYYMLTASLDWSTSIASARFANCQNPANNGYIELCKQTDPDYPVTGPFTFTVTTPFFSTGPIVVPVGGCSPPTQVPSGVVTINEVPQVGVAVENVTAYSDGPFGQVDELDSWTFPQPTATVTVVPGGVNLETVATFTNYQAPPGQLKICKVAASSSLIGTLFTFTATDGTTYHTDTVEAGPPPGGYCVVDGAWPVNDPVTITETNIPPGVSVSGITFNQGPAGPCNPPVSYCGVGTIMSGINEVSFTDTVIIGSCSNSSSLSVLQVQGNNVVAFVPLSNWLQIPGYMNGIQAANVEGNYISSPGGYYSVPYNGSPISEDINSCASDPIYGQTVCTANGLSKNVYVIANTGTNGLPQVTNVVPTTHSGGQITFTGGCCTTCGVAMDPVQHKAVIGLSIGGSGAANCPARTPTGYPGFQFLDLSSNGTPVMEDPPIKSLAHQISEDWVVDPTSNPPQILSPSEGLYCYPYSPLLCNTSHPNPNYEIADITYPVGGGNATLQFYENGLATQHGYNNGLPDSSALDCSAEIALASSEFEGLALSTPCVADLNQATFTGTTWTDAYPGSLFYPLAGSDLPLTSGTNAGPIAVAQGGSHEGVLGQESASRPSDPTANTITAFKLQVPWVNGMPFHDWVTCNLGDMPSNPPAIFNQGADPHTVTAYQSPNPPYHSFAVLANEAPATYLAVVDLDMMLGPLVTRFGNNPNVCNTPPIVTNYDGQMVGTLPTAVVRFVQVRP